MTSQSFAGAGMVSADEGRCRPKNDFLSMTIQNEKILVIFLIIGLISCSTQKQLTRNLPHPYTGTTAKDHTGDPLKTNFDKVNVYLSGVPSITTYPMYYVSNTGIDAADGLTMATAWQTISKVNSSTFTPGTQVNFNKGDTWRESLIVPSSGIASNYITFGAYGAGAKPKILGSELVTTWSPAIIYPANVWCSDITLSDPTTAKNIYFKETDGSINWGRIQKSDLLGLAQEYDWVWLRDHIYIYSPTDPNTRYSGVEVGQRNLSISLNNKEYISINGLELGYGVYGVYDFNYPPVALLGLKVEDCYIHHEGVKSAGYGIATTHSSALIKSNIIHDTGRRGISINTSDIFTGSVTVKDIIIENNTLYNGHHTTGIDIINHVNGIMYNIIIRKNLIYDDPNVMIDGVEILGSVGVFISNQGGAPITNVYVYNNVFRNLKASGLQMEGITSFVYNNTFYGVNSSLAPAGVIGFIYNTRSTCTAKNNIFYVNTNPAVNNKYYAMIVVTATQTSDCNLYFNPIGSTGKLIYSGSGYTFANWEAYKSATGQDANSPTPADPLFTSTSDYILQAGSPAINTGVVITGMPQSDYLGHPIIGLRDIGAFEKQ